MNIIKSFENAFKRAEEKNWDYIYILVDIHGTIFKPSYYNKEKYEFYPYAQLVLQLFSSIDNIKLILWSSSYEKDIEKYNKKLKENFINFNYINENPEVENTDIQYFDKKLYFNVGLDDKFGFDPETDWKELWIYLINKNCEI